MFNRSHRQRFGAAALGTLTALGVLTVAPAAPAGAAIPASFGIAPDTKLVAAQPMLDAMEIDGFAPNSTLNVELWRNGSLIATAAVPTDVDGNTVVNGDATTCWSNITPDMLPGDIIVIDGTDALPVDDDVITQPATAIAADSVEVRGTAFTFLRNGTRVAQPADTIEVRLLNAAFKNFSAKNKLVTGVDPSTVVADPNVPGGFIATFTNLSPDMFGVATDAATTTELRSIVLTPGIQSTIIDNSGALGGPVDPACPPATVTDRVTSVSPTAINAATGAVPLQVTGVSPNPGQVKVRVTNGAATAGPFSATATGASTWTLSIAANALANLGDGTWTVTGIDATNTVFPTPPLTVTRDTAAPAAPTANPGAASFTAVQSVSLFDVDPNAVIRFTTDGTNPTTASPVFSSPISVGFGTTTVKAIAVDPAGNLSPVSSFTYSISQPAPVQPPAQPAAAANTNGYRLVGADGGMFTFGTAGFFGSLGGSRLNAPIITSVATPSGNGYWMVGADGGIFSFGDAAFHGSTGGQRLNQPIVGMVPTKSGNGYWLVARDGGIFSFGDAAFHGSTGGQRLNQPIVGMARTLSGNGYWLVARDGGIFSFGDAAFYGSTGGTRLNQPIIGMSMTRTGQGYSLLARDGGLFSFGDAAFFGSTGGTRLNQPIVGMMRTASGNGYWMVAGDGGIFAFGDAGFFGSTGGMRLNQPIIGMI